MPYVNIRLVKGVSDAQKEALIEKTTATLVDVLGKSPKSCFVVIDEVEAENWGVGGESIARTRATDQAG